MVTQARSTATDIRLLSRAEARSLTDCEHCPLGCGIALPPRAVRGLGSATADVVLIGEAPGLNEIAQDAPFVGISGTLTQQVLKAQGVAWTDTYRTNALLCMPPKQVSQKAIRACSARLDAELDACTSKRVLFVVGKSAALALRGEALPMSKLNGTVEWNERHQCWAVYAYHPAYVLRNADAYDEFVWAASRVARMCQPGATPPTLPTLTFHTAHPDDYDDACRLADAMRQRLIICDIETTGLNPRTDRILEIGLRWQDEPPFIIPAETWTTRVGWRSALRALFGNRSITFVGHNYKFDCEFLQAAGFPALVGGDTMLLHHCLDERSGVNDDGGWSGGHHDLKTLAQYYLDWPDWSVEVDKQMKALGGMEGIPAAERRQYHAYDLEATWRLWYVLRRRVRNQPPSRKGYPTPLDCHDTLLVPAANAVARMQAHGIRLDLERLNALTADYTRMAAESTEEMRVLAQNDTLNPRSWQQVAEVLYTPEADGGLGYQNLRKTDKLTLHELQRRDAAAGNASSAFLEATMRTRSLLTTKRTYLDGLRKRLDADGRIRTNLLLHGTVTGRLASRNPNLQNIPADSVIKELFIPSAGMVMANADYKQLEVRALAWYSHDAALCAALRAADFHWEVCKVAFAEIVAALQAATTVADLDAVARSTSMFDEFARRQSVASQRTDDFATLYGWLKTRLRRKAKYVTFGNIYGEGAEALAQEEKGLGCTVKEARKFQTDWRKTYKRAAAYLDGQTTLAEREGWVESATGRRRRFQRVAYGMASSIQTESRNHPVQAFASDINLMALTTLERLLPEKGLGYVLLPVHDSLLFELVADRLDEATQLITTTMTSVVVSEHVLFDVDLAVGANWSACH